MLLMSSLRLMTSCWGSLPPPQGCPPPSARFRRGGRGAQQPRGCC